MADVITRKFFTDILEDYAGRTLKIALLSSDAVTGEPPVADVASSEIECFSELEVYEVDPDDGVYVAGGKVITGMTVNANDKQINASNVVWETSNITARHAVLYDDASPQLVIAIFDLGGDQTTADSDFTINFATNGVLKLN